MYNLPGFLRGLNATTRRVQEAGPIQPSQANTQPVSFSNRIDTRPFGACPCGNQTARGQCTGCRGIPGSRITFYCSRNCQEAHWEVHKKTCWSLIVRKRFYRAAQLLKDAWLVYRRISYDVLVERVEIVKNDILVTEGDMQLARKQRGGRMTFSFLDSSVENEEVKKAILCDIMCMDAVAYMHETIKSVLSGLVSQAPNPFAELDLEVKNQTWNVRHIKPSGLHDPTQYDHHVLRIKVKNGEDYILGLTSAQYGWHDDAFPYQEYMDQCARRVKERRSFGGCKEYMNGVAMAYLNGETVDGPMAVLALHQELCEIWDDGVGRWLESQNRGGKTVTWDDLLKLPEEDWKRTRDDFLNTMARGMTGVPDRLPYRVGDPENHDEEIRFQREASEHWSRRTGK